MVTDLKRGGAGKKVGGGGLRADDERFEFSDVREKKDPIFLRKWERMRTGHRIGELSKQF